ncbi:MAG: cytochrome c oxidase subunit II, partial [Myxococcales bacterium]
MNETLRRFLFLPDQASTFAYDVDRLHYFVILTTFVMSTAVGLTAIFFFIRYRRRSETQTTPHIEPAPLLEAAFVIVPLAFFLLWWVIGYRTSIALATPPA